MYNPTKKNGSDRDRLLSSIDELEKLLSGGRQEAAQKPPLETGIDGVPVLLETMEEDGQLPVSMDIDGDGESVNEPTDNTEQNTNPESDN